MWVPKTSPWWLLRIPESSSVTGESSGPISVTVTEIQHSSKRLHRRESERCTLAYRQRAVCKQSQGQEQVVLLIPLHDYIFGFSIIYVTYNRLHSNKENNGIEFSTRFLFWSGILHPKLVKLKYVNWLFLSSLTSTKTVFFSPAGWSYSFPHITLKVNVSYCWSTPQRFICSHSKLVKFGTRDAVCIIHRWTFNIKACRLTVHIVRHIMTFGEVSTLNLVHMDPVKTLFWTLV